MMKPGGTEGGEAAFFGGLGLVLTGLGLYLLFDSVQVQADGPGLVSHWLAGAGGWQTTSRGVVFLPLLLGVAVLFYNAKWKIGWALLWSGLAVIAIEILSRLRFAFSMKTSHLILILGTTAAGIGLLLRGLRDSPADPPQEK